MYFHTSSASQQHMQLESLKNKREFTKSKIYISICMLSYTRRNRINYPKRKERKLMMNPQKRININSSNHSNPFLGRQRPENGRKITCYNVEVECGCCCRELSLGRGSARLPWGQGTDQGRLQLLIFGCGCQAFLCARFFSGIHRCRCRCGCLGANRSDGWQTVLCHGFGGGHWRL
jgi:hypothetical protein